LLVRAPLAHALVSASQVRTSAQARTSAQVRTSAGRYSGTPTGGSPQRITSRTDEQGVAGRTAEPRDCDSVSAARLAVTSPGCKQQEPTWGVWKHLKAQLLVPRLPAVVQGQVPASYSGPSCMPSAFKGAHHCEATIPGGPPHLSFLLALGVPRTLK